MTTHPADTSNLSISGVEDWDAVSSNGTVPFPAGDSQEEEHRTPEGTGRSGDGNGRTLSQLLRLYAEKGTDVCFSQEEADAVAEALGQWVNYLLLSPSAWLKPSVFFDVDQLWLFTLRG
jgi:hypothetical protein